jgi:hypothetical protein
MRPVNDATQEAGAAILTRAAGRGGGYVAVLPTRSRQASSSVLASASAASSSQSVFRHSAVAPAGYGRPVASLVATTPGGSLASGASTKWPVSRSHRPIGGRPRTHRGTLQNLYSAVRIRSSPPNLDRSGPGSIPGALICSRAHSRQPDSQAAQLVLRGHRLDRDDAVDSPADGPAPKWRNRQTRRS